MAAPCAAGVFVATSPMAGFSGVAGCAITGCGGATGTAAVPSPSGVPPRARSRGLTAGDRPDGRLHQRSPPPATGTTSGDCRPRRAASCLDPSSSSTSQRFGATLAKQPAVHSGETHSAPRSREPVAQRPPEVERCSAALSAWSLPVSPNPEAHVASAGGYSSGFSSASCPSEWPHAGPTSVSIWVSVVVGHRSVYVSRERTTAENSTYGPSHAGSYPWLLGLLGLAGLRRRRARRAARGPSRQ